MNSLRQSQHVQRSHNVCLHRLHRIELIVNRRRGTRQVINLIDFQKDGLDNVVAQQLETVIVQKVTNVLAPPGKKVIETNNFVTNRDQSIAQIRSDKSCPSSYQYPHLVLSVRRFTRQRERLANVLRRITLCQGTRARLIQ